VKKLYSATDHHLLVFEEIICLYQLAMSTVRSTLILDYTKMSGVGGKATHTGRSCVVRPSLYDFIADVGISARRSLESHELAYFIDHYKSCSVLVRDVEDRRNDQLTDSPDKYLAAHIQTFPSEDQPFMEAYDRNVREKLGDHLLKVRVSPYTRYMERVDVSARKKKNARLILMQRHSSRSWYVDDWAA
jgi:hypothetical protein